MLTWIIIILYLNLWEMESTAVPSPLIWHRCGSKKATQLLVVCIANRKGNQTQSINGWRTAAGITGWSLAHSLTENGLLITNFKKSKLRRRYSRKKNHHPCACGMFFFCKYRITCGVQHKKPKAPRFGSHSQDSPFLHRCLLLLPLPPATIPGRRNPWDQLHVMFVTGESRKRRSLKKGYLQSCYGWKRREVSCLYQDAPKNAECRYGVSFTYTHR
jgi:hypothetical protein